MYKSVLLRITNTYIKYIEIEKRSADMRNALNENTSQL